MTPPPIITSFDTERRNNAQLMRDVATLGYLDCEHDYVLDCTYKNGRFWSLVRPTRLLGTDLDPRFSDPSQGSVDFRDLPFRDETFDVTVIDGPYKLNGTSTGAGPASSDEDYGVHVPSRWQDRHALINAGIYECVRVTKNRGYVMVKCQDQVCLTKVRWQTHEFTATANAAGCRLVDQLHVYGSRKQPRDGTDRQSQDHSRRNYSTLLVLRKEG